MRAVNLTLGRRRLTAIEVLERLHTARRILAAVAGCGRVSAEPFGEPWRSGSEVIRAIGELEAYARRLGRLDVAAYAGDVGQYARHVLAELLLAAPAASDARVT